MLQLLKYNRDFNMKYIYIINLNIENLKFNKMVVYKILKLYYKILKYNFFENN